MWLDWFHRKRSFQSWLTSIALPLQPYEPRLDLRYLHRIGVSKWLHCRFRKFLYYDSFTNSFTQTHAHMHVRVHTHTSVKTDVPQDPSTFHLQAAFSLFPAPDRNGQEAQHLHSHGDRCFMLRTTMAATHSVLSSHSPQQVSFIVAIPTPYPHFCCPWELTRRKKEGTDLL